MTTSSMRRSRLDDPGDGRFRLAGHDVDRRLMPAGPQLRLRVGRGAAVASCGAHRQQPDFEPDEERRAVDVIDRLHRTGTTVEGGSAIFSIGPKAREATQYRFFSKSARCASRFDPRCSFAKSAASPRLPDDDEVAVSLRPR